MTHEELSRLEKEAGWQMVGIPIAQFKDLVIAAERELCALVCEEFYSVENIAQKCAEAIKKGE